MEFFQLLAQGSRLHRWRALIYMGAAGFSMMAIAAIVTTIADSNLGETARYELLVVFLLACASAIVFNLLAQNLTIELCEGALESLRLRIIGLIRGADLDRLERIGQATVYDSVARNITLVSESAALVVYAMIGSIALVLAGLYIITLSTLAFVVVSVVFIVLGYAHHFVQRHSLKAYVNSRAAESRFFELLSHLLWGFKEVKMSSARADDLQENFLLAQSSRVEELKVISGREFNKGLVVAYAAFYFLLGTVTFALPQHLSSTEVAIKVVYMVVFMLSTMDIAVRGLPVLSKVNVALDQLQTLEAELRAAGHGQEGNAKVPGPQFERIDLRGLSFSYVGADGTSTFTVGPCDLTIHRGETIFIVGGNGSGKSTLLRLITRLYEPQAGTLLWDGKPVTYDHVADYRNLFAGVFADFHLFDRLYGHAEENPERVNMLLAEYGLGQKVEYLDGAFSNTDLSTGQRKRLALIVALLEDKPIVVLDELSADQDPAFRRRYYEDILPALKKEGRTVLAVSHDDRYFSVADRVFDMEDGRLVSVKGAR